MTEGGTEVRRRSYRIGTTLSGGQSTAHYYMRIDPSEGIAIEEPLPEEQEGKKKKSRLTVVGRLKPSGDNENLFATEIDESVLLAARSRLQAKFGLITWEPKQVITERMGDIVFPKVGYYLSEAETALTHDKPDVCLRLLVRVTHLDKERSASLECQMRFVALTELCDFQAANVLATRCSFPKERMAWCFFAYGQSLLDAGLFNQSLAAFIAAGQMEPERLEHRLKQIEVLYKMKRYVECVGVVSDLLREYKHDKPRCGDLYTLRARLHDHLSNVKEVLADIQRALRIDPNHDGAQHFLHDFRKKSIELRDEAMVFYAKGRFREAADRLTTCMQTDPNNPDFYFKRGLVNRRLGDYRQAIDDLLASMEKMERFAEANNVSQEAMQDARRQLILLLNDMSVDCYRRRLFNDAIHLLDRAIRFEKKEVAFYVNRGDCFYAIEELEMALGDYEQASELDRTNDAIATRLVLVHSHRGLLAMRDRKFMDAEAALSEAIKVRPLDFDLRILRCRCRIMIDRSRDAAYDIVVALALNAPPADPHVATLLPRLFPGLTAEEVLTGDMAKSVFAEMGLRKDMVQAQSGSLVSSNRTLTDMFFSAEVNELITERMVIDEEMHFLASEKNREEWLKLAAKLAPRTTKWRGAGPDAGPLDRPLLGPAVARIGSAGSVKLVSKEKDSYAFRWQAADVKSLTRIKPKIEAPVVSKKTAAQAKTKTN